MRSRLASSLVLSVALTGCSLAYDFSPFHEADADVEPSADAAGLDAARVDGGSIDAASSDIDAGMVVDVDAATPTEADAGTDAAMAPGTDAAMPGMDAAVGTDSAVGTDAATVVPDASVVTRDAALPTLDAALATESCGGLSTLRTLDLGAVTNLPTPVVNTRWAVRAVGNDLAVTWVDALGNAHLRSWSIVGTTPTPVIADRVLATGVSSSSTLGLGRDGTDWVVWIYTSPSTIVRCGDASSACTTATPPASSASPFAFVQQGSTFAWLYSSSTTLDWRASAIGGTSFELAPQPSHIVTPDGIGTGGSAGVAIVEQGTSTGPLVAFAWFDTAARATRLTPSTLGRTVNGIYATFDATTGKAIGVAAVGTSTNLITAHLSASEATVEVSWPSTATRPIVSLGDGTVFVFDGTQYGLRAVSAASTVRTSVAESGWNGAAVVVDGHYATFWLPDLGSELTSSSGRMALSLYTCLPSAEL